MIPRPSRAPSVAYRGIRLGGLSGRGAWVAFDDDPIFPVDRFVDGRGTVHWPPGLRPRLPALSSTKISLVGLEGEALWAQVHDFGGPQPWQTPRDPWGRKKSINKWGWFDLRLVDRSDAERARAVRDAAEVIKQLNTNGRPAWVVGGTLLGAVREADLIDHDDDVDVAYLASSSEPEEVALESFGLERELSDLGWASRRFSGAQFQLQGPAVGGMPAIHVDVFSAFFRDGLVNQPFHVRGPFRPDQLLPLGEVSLAGVTLPAPRDTDGWLELNYGADWRTPQPGHALDTPRATQRRFSGWFGHYLDHWEFWTDYYERESHGSVEDAPSGSARWLAQRLPRGTVVVELGCGRGADARFLADSGYAVLATDYVTAPSDELVLPDSGASFGRLNVADPRELMRLAVLCRRSDRPIHLHVRNLVEGLEIEARRNLLGFLEHLPEGGSISLTARIGPQDGGESWDPAGATVSRRSIELALQGDVVRWSGPTPEPGGSGLDFGIWWGERNAMGIRAAARTARSLPGGLRDLRADVMELRRTPLRLAEIRDVVITEMAARPAVTEQSPERQAAATGPQVDDGWRARSDWPDEG